jgi:hypothetical protein
VGDGVSGPPVTAPGRPSRGRDEWSSTHGSAGAPVDLEAIDWELPLPEPGSRLSRDLVARWLASGDARPVRALTATSRAPGSRLNRVAPNLSSDLTASLEIVPTTDDRGRVVVATQVRGNNRRARRVLDDVGLDGGWVRRRGTASTTLRRAAPPEGRPRVTALRTADAIAAVLDRAAWPLSTWVLTVRDPD